MAIPVSGPGQFSQRTDRQPIAQIPNADYGEQKAYKQLQQNAPMAQSSGQPQGVDFASLFGSPADRVIPIGAETGMPNTPVTDGAALGAGAGIDAMQFQNPDDQTRARLTAWLPALEFLSNRPDSSSSARALIRRIKATL